MNSKSNTTRDILVGFAVGAVVGAVVGLLLAPATGEETRDLLSENARKVSDDLKKQAQRAIETIESAKEATTEYINENMHEAKEKADELRDKAKHVKV